MKTHRLRNTIIILLLLIGAFVVVVLAGGLRTTSVSPEATKPLSASEMEELRPRGRELVLAGDCFGCHSQPTGPQAAGGVAVSTPFGTIYSTNITPDKTHGIGNYTREDFHRVLRDGIAPGDRNLYPAMPYVFTHITRPEDIDAMYAYLMSIEPMNVANKENTGIVAYPVRPFMNFWDLINFPDRKAPTADDGRSEVWARGAYLANGVAHCAACHTPMNFMWGTEFDRHFEGSELDGMAIPNITPEALSAHGFDVPTLTQYLSTGMAPQGTSFAGMHTVTHFSTSAMEKDDVEAIATYLLTDNKGNILEPKEKPVPLAQAAHPTTDEMITGQRVYMAACAGCHGGQGEGIPNVFPALEGNGVVEMENPQDVIQVVLNGIVSERFGGYKRMYAMPPFSHDLSDEEIADLVTWIRAEWGGQAEPVTVEEVQKYDRAVH